MTDNNHKTLSSLSRLPGFSHRIKANASQSSHRSPHTTPSYLCVPVHTWPSPSSESSPLQSYVHAESSGSAVWFPTQTCVLNGCNRCTTRRHVSRRPIETTDSSYQSIHDQHLSSRTLTPSSRRTHSSIDVAMNSRWIC